uniref:Uncharacterized protein n=1 Tax=Glossina austeni TaxID=7395 RepID=A0A1A9VL00_GLOAU
MYLIFRKLRRLRQPRETPASTVTTQNVRTQALLCETLTNLILDQLVSGLDLDQCPLFVGSHRINRCDQFLQADVKKHREPPSFVTNTRRQPNSTNNRQRAILDATATKINDVMHLHTHKMFQE